MTPPFNIPLHLPLKLVGVIQHYDWGKCGAESLVARLARCQDEQLPCAELWFGAHPKGPATVCWEDRRCKLDQLIAEDPNRILGQRVTTQFGGSLPFLLKVISVRSALSIQVHPDRERAGVLHRSNPTHYLDPNHKPELAIALTPVDLLYGFRPAEELLAALDQCPELQAIIGPENVRDAAGRCETIGHDIFQKLLRQPTEIVNRYGQALFRRLEQSKELTPEDQIVLSLKTRFPQGDRGLFCVYLLNLKRLQPGEGLFVEPNVLHAYLAGDLIECMANSDNVVRVGLTNKFQDVETMLELLPHQQARFQPITPGRSGVGGFISYQVPVGEFCLEYLTDVKKPIAVKSQDSIEMLLCIEGRGTLCGKDWEVTIDVGDAFIIPAAVSEWELKCFAGQLYRVSVP